MKLDSVKVDTVTHTLETMTPVEPGKTPVTVDSVKVTSDKPVTEIDTYAKRFNPHRASLYSMVIPGAGQFYVKKYWKIPLVWGGFAGFIYGVSFSQNELRRFKNELFNTINYPNYTVPGGYAQSQLRTIVDELRRQRDYLLILNFFFYVLQIVDAHVDAHLKEFTLNPNLQVRAESMPIQYSSVRSTGLTLSFKF